MCSRWRSRSRQTSRRCSDSCGSSADRTPSRAPARAANALTHPGAPLKALVPTARQTPRGRAVQVAMRRAFGQVLISVVLRARRARAPGARGGASGSPSPWAGGQRSARAEECARGEAAARAAAVRVQAARPRRSCLVRFDRGRWGERCEEPGARARIRQGCIRPVEVPAWGTRTSRPRCLPAAQGYLGNRLADGACCCAARRRCSVASRFALRRTRSPRACGAVAPTAAAASVQVVPSPAA